jgi:hypothetical protein
MGDLAAQDDYTTPLAADDINDFQKWKQQYAPHDSGYDYDLPGAYLAGLTPDTATGHFDDQFKKPNHPTFSTFSQYAKDRPDLAGTWQGDQYIPPPARSNLSPDETLMQPPPPGLLDQLRSGARSVVGGIHTMGSYLGIPQGDIRNAAGDVVFPTNALERGLQRTSDDAKTYAAAVIGPGRAPDPLMYRPEPMGSLADIAGYANPRLRAKAEALRGKYPQYAEDYPDIGPPELMSKLPDPKNPGKFLSKADKPVPYTTMEEALTKDAEPGFFLEKKLTPEAAQFQKDRSTIQQDMDLHGYEPYFDPAKRFDVNPKNYGPFDDTSIAAAPKTAKTDAEWYAKYGTPEARQRLQEGFQKGQTIEGSPDWYFMGQLEKEYTKELGPKAGREAFKREFGDMMAATTGGASPYNNFLMSQYANVMAKRGERMPERSYELPFPVGGRYAAGNIAQAQKYVDEGQVGFSAAANPKRYDFSSAFQGNKNAATTDEQMMNALQPGVNIPEWYGPATRVIREEAQKAGVDPRGFQDVGWAGLKSGKVEAKGNAFNYEGPMINHINRSIETTHRLTGMPRAEIVRRGLVRKEIPMYGLGGLAIMGGLARQDDYQ